jgi:energy-coupling factor transporter ATP-binding protein EcfA2
MSNFATVEALAAHLRQELESKKYLLLFAYNGTGKTRLSMAFKDIEKKTMRAEEYALLPDPKPPIVDEFPVENSSGEHIELVKLAGDTLYFNAFTEDLFSWDNDLDGDSDRFLKLNNQSQFFYGLEDLEMETRIRRILNRYADFDFTIKYEFDDFVKKNKMSEVRFSRETTEGDTTKTYENIKVSRGEENLFIWCFFLAIVELAMDKEIEAYSWVKYVYIDDPISSLDENNAVSVAHHLAQLLKDNKSPLKAIISSHHALFFNVLCNEFHRVKGVKHHFLSRSKITETYTLKDTGDTPFFYHVAMLAELHKAAQSGNLYTYHFSMLRIILEKTASFHGYKGFTHCIQKAEDDPEGVLHTRLINILNHGNYSHYEPQEMLQENKDIFRKILNDFMQNYKFNTEVFPELVDTQQEVAA